MTGVAEFVLSEERPYAGGVFLSGLVGTGGAYEFPPFLY